MNLAEAHVRNEVIKCALKVIATMVIVYAFSKSDSWVSTVIYIAIAAFILKTMTLFNKETHFTMPEDIVPMLMTCAIIAVLSFGLALIFDYTPMQIALFLSLIELSTAWYFSQQETKVPRYNHEEDYID